MNIDEPINVAGWLSEAEGRLLAKLAAGKTVLEIGSYCVTERLKTSHP